MAMSTCRYLHRPMRTVWASSQTVSRCFTTEDNGFSNKWYELRTYKIQPAKLQDFMKLSIDKINLRFNHSKGIGYWMADIGGLNEAVHIWEYDNFAHRTKVRKQMSEDPSWNAEYLSKMLPMLVNQESVALKAVPWYPLQDTPKEEGGIYELRYYVLSSKYFQSYDEALKDALLARVEQHNELNYGKLMGVWHSNIGTLHKVYHLWNWRSLDMREEGRAVVNSTKKVVDASKDIMKMAKQAYNKILIPAPFSPLK